MNISNQVSASLQKLKLWGEEVDSGHWQGVTTEGKPDLVTLELLNLGIDAQMPGDMDQAQNLLSPNLPWAEDHFQERVSRVPSNPGEQYKNWPWWSPEKEQVTVAGIVGDIYPEASGRSDIPEPFKFTHTYQERFWPKHSQADWESRETQVWEHMKGIRYEYGDLDDVVNLLREHPFTRQATFPIFFPEDTGAVHGGRIPCTLHYHFLRRGDHLHLWYPLRSCDAIRHFRDDVYMAVRLCQWVINELTWVKPDESWQDVKPGFLHFTAYSFHVHKGDLHLL